MTLKPGDLLPVKEARRLLPLPRATFYRLLQRGLIESRRVPGPSGKRAHVLVVRASLEAYIASPPVPEPDTVDGILAMVSAEQQP